MEKEFIPYELAVKLKELGFDDLCIARYYGGGFRLLPAYDPLKNSEIKEPWFSVAPLWQQAFDWFREKHGFICDPKKYIDWYFDIEKIVDGIAETDWIENTLSFPTYESARLACLEKLIEIVSCKSEN